MPAKAMPLVTAQIGSHLGERNTILNQGAKLIKTTRSYFS